ncbi:HYPOTHETICAL PROTEIN MCJ_004460 [Mesomycoplasma conjunctivae]|uniref:Uncharacterized protein n=1 Tax=Mesomycoplasma conjunctivae (strain ATCC 25834 / NCTC 10147 / HRC/581) TaxID=572263 RepID=C5J6N9_MESCH|nr:HYPOTHETICAL PROTEIN MCJ_004460 [Mesomycoplasma conjunctivae]
MNKSLLVKFKWQICKEYKKRLKRKSSNSNTFTNRATYRIPTPKEGKLNKKNKQKLPKTKD